MGILLDSTILQEPLYQEIICVCIYIYIMLEHFRSPQSNTQIFMMTI